MTGGVGWHKERARTSSAHSPTCCVSVWEAFPHDTDDALAECREPLIGSQHDTPEMRLVLLWQGN